MASATTDLPTRTGTDLTTATSRTDSDDGAFAGEDTSEVTKLFHDRLNAWRHVVQHLEDYVEGTEKLHHSSAKDYDKIVKTVSKPLKQPDAFDQNLGGVNGLLDNLRTNTQAIANSHNETEKVIKGSVTGVFSRLDKEIKAKNKELVKGAGKGSKAVDKARAATQKHIETLGQSSAIFDSRGGKMAASEDPYVVQRGVTHRLNKQLIEENTNRQDLLSVQNNFASFEAHIISTIQAGLGQFNSVISKHAEVTKNLYGDIVGTAQRIPPQHEWVTFLKRNSGVLIDPDAGPRELSSITFPNQNHRSTQPLIAGSLERKSKLLRKYDAGYYVVTPAKFLHEYKTDDDIAKDPTPELSLFLPDCIVGQAIGEKFVVKGKDSSKGPMGLSVHGTHEYNFKAHSAADALKWWTIIRDAAGSVTEDVPSDSAPNSPVTAETGADEKFGALAAQQSGTTGTTTAAAHPSAADEKAALAARDAQAAPATSAAPAASTVPAAETHAAAPAAVAHPAAAAPSGPAPSYADPVTKS